ncbi:MAG TPA: uracil-DNA glycosylase [Acetobacteraceae bacterium]|jgi:uracil-DNA glycosylase family 4|nr:uracil-DNA glycosylase [Acetobacteraceae bacterium]
MKRPEEPARDCLLCPRLVAYRGENQAAHPDWHNAPVSSFGAIGAEILIVGMAPGLAGANRTGRPFTGDYAGKLLYETLIRFGLAVGTYGASAEDGLGLQNCRITNAVRCAPPANLPTPEEVRTCNRFLLAELQAMSRLRAVLALGVLAHGAVVRAFGLPLAQMKFRHGAIHERPDGLLIADSYHVSRYNTSTGRLTEKMFASVIAALRRRLERAA